MAKKSSSMSFVYGIGMLLAAIGFCLPIFNGKGFSLTGWDLVGDGDTTIKIFTLLIFVGAVVGVVAAFLPIPQAKLLKVIALAVSIISFIIVMIMVGNTKSAKAVKSIVNFFGAEKKGMEMIFKSLYVGAYMIFGGWIVSVAGLILNK